MKLHFSSCNRRSEQYLCRSAHARLEGLLNTPYKSLHYQTCTLRTWRTHWSLVLIRSSHSGRETRQGRHRHIEGGVVFAIARSTL